MKLVEVSPYDMTTFELIDEAARRRAAGEEEHADELLRFAVARNQAVAAYPDLPVQEAMRRRRAEELAGGPGLRLIRGETR